MWFLCTLDEPNPTYLGAIALNSGWKQYTWEGGMKTWWIVAVCPD